ncbi:universal stress protein [Janibacter indicus]|uniref:Universal stress protein n=1 Tax=Janibacter indicus TaxID=857417 RepID=A0A1W2CAK6_9MICO|nr:universal stress protein [Janibacter indicus]QOK21335.1 universal stress protein [Janibacter indicus]SMC81892.1 Nucleotide-binding universal stress protein, UspA family [Janibacter indicus]
MHVLIATDGSRQSLRAARHFKSFADPGKVEQILVLAVTRPLASVSFVDEISADAKAPRQLTGSSFKAEAEAAVAVIAGEFDDWSETTRVRTRVRSGTPSSEIIRAAKVSGIELIVVASGSRGLTDKVFIGSTAQRVQSTAPCPVLVVRPVPRQRRRTKA